MKRILFILAMLIAMNVNAQWVQMSEGIGNTRTVSALCASGSIIYAGTNGLGLFLSTNNGLNWTQTGLGNYYYVTNITISENNIFAAAYYNQQYNSVWNIYLSTNNGSSWSQKGLGNQVIFSLTSIGSNIFAGVNYSGVYRSTNNGTNWNQTALVSERVDNLSSSGNIIFASTYGGNGLFWSSNNGTNWLSHFFNAENVNSAAAIGNNFITSVGWQGIYFSSNSGANWTLSDLTNTRSDEIITYGNNIFTCNHANGGLGGVYYSSNNGANWVDISQGLNGHPTVYDIYIANNYIFAGIESQSVWRRPLSEIIGIQNISTETPSKYSLSQNYPNPFNSTSNLKFQIVNTGDVKLIVYDIMGKEVQTLVNERLQPGTYEAAFDASTLNTGIYFYKLITNTFSETKKMLLIK